MGAEQGARTLIGIKLFFSASVRRQPEPAQVHRHATKVRPVVRQGQDQPNACASRLQQHAVQVKERLFNRPLGSGAEQDVLDLPLGCVGHAFAERPHPRHLQPVLHHRDKQRLGVVTIGLAVDGIDVGTDKAEGQTAELKLGPKDRHKLPGHDRRKRLSRHDRRWHGPLSSLRKRGPEPKQPHPQAHPPSDHHGMESHGMGTVNQDRVRAGNVTTFAQSKAQTPHEPVVDRSGDAGIYTSSSLLLRRPSPMAVSGCVRFQGERLWLA